MHSILKVDLLLKRYIPEDYENDTLPEGEDDYVAREHDDGERKKSEPVVFTEEKRNLAAQFVGEDELAKVVAAAETRPPKAKAAHRKTKKNGASWWPSPHKSDRGSSESRLPGPRVAGLEKVQRENMQALQEATSRVDRMEEAIMEIRSSLSSPSQTSGLAQRSAASSAVSR
jgi:hypothetical protein